MRTNITRFILLVIGFFTAAQVNAQSLAINTDGSTAQASALLDVKSTSKGLLIPRMSKAEKNAIATPATGLLVFQNAPDSIGFYYYNGTGWLWLTNSSQQDTVAWKTNGNTGLNDNHYLGHTNVVPINFRIDSVRYGRLHPTNFSVSLGRDAGSLSPSSGNHISIGDSAGSSTTTTNTSIFIGKRAGRFVTSGFNQIMIGTQAGLNTTTGSANIFIGAATGRDNVTGTGNLFLGHATGILSVSSNYNTAMGHQAFNQYRRSGDGYNTAIGSFTMEQDTSGYWNTGIGTSAFRENQSGYENTGVGINAGYHQRRYRNTFVGSYAGYGDRPNNNFLADTGRYNTGMGAYSFYRIANGIDNVALGYQTAYFDSSGSSNTAIGTRALFYNIKGNGKTAIGYEALYSDTLSIDTLELNTAIGYKAIRNSRFSEYNTAVGGFALENAGSTGTPTTPQFNGGWNTAIGHSALNATTTGFSNVGIGTFAGAGNITGIGNVVIGTLANSSGNPTSSVCIGWFAGSVNNAISNTFIGSGSGSQNNAGFSNTFIGSGSGDNNITGDLNTILGYNTNVSSANLTNATAIGANAFVAQNNSLVLGSISGINAATASTNIGIGITTPNTKLHIDGGTDANVAIATSGYLLLGDATAANLVMDDNEILARNNGAAATLYLQYQSGNVVIGANTAGSHKLSVNGDAAKVGGGSWAVYSDRRLKKDIAPYTDGLSSLLKINPVSFNYNEVTGYDTKKTYIGVIAQELQQVSPYMVSDLTIKANDGTPYLQVDNSAMTYMLINAVKEQQTQMNETKKEIEELKKLVLQQQQIISSLQKQ